MAESQGLSKRELRREVQAIKVPVRVVTELNHLERPDLHDALQLIIDLAQEIEGYRDLTEEEEKAVADAAAYLDAQGYWAARDREFLKTLAHRRDWLPDAQAEFPHRTVPALQCMMQKVRAELGMSDQRTVDRVMVPDSGRMVAAIQLAGVHP
jgi:post-segregation antitoxin (ccd killing protein)